VAIELPDDLIKLEESAWAQIQANELTAETAAAVQARITEVAAAAGENRYDVERALKAAVRHPAPAE
jgi:hypothetical protein